MIEYAVKNDFYSVFVSFFYKFPKRFVCTERFVNRKIVFCVVFMLGTRLIYRRHINSGNSKRLKIVQPVYNSLKVSAVNIVPPCLFTVFSPFLKTFRLKTAFSPAEARRKNLVEYSRFCPFGSAVYVCRIHPGKCKAACKIPNPAELFFRVKACFKEIRRFALRFQRKEITAAFGRRSYRRAPQKMFLKFAPSGHFYTVTFPYKFAVVPFAVKRVCPMQKDALNVFSGFNSNFQIVVIQRITKSIKCLMIDSR